MRCGEESEEGSGRDTRARRRRGGVGKVSGGSPWCLHVVGESGTRDRGEATVAPSRNERQGEAEPSFPDHLHRALLYKYESVNVGEMGTVMSRESQISFLNGHLPVSRSIAPHFCFQK